MKSHRLARVSEVVREVAAEAILFEVRDPRVKGVTVTRADVSADLQHAKVFVSLMGTQKEQQLTLHGLTAAAGFVQAKLAKRLTTRYVPHVTFVLDEGIKKSIEIARLIAEEKARMAPDPADGGAAAADPDHADQEDKADDDAPDRPADDPAAPGRTEP